ncbi:MAG: TonB-dependent receptor [Candidatus Thiodiazotropha sp. (ex Troendleina suluensis)]|nr:TonB-dependent receptor [Candidatus Thiodiazotropha sp. (ex Troendleina suluensis)]
MAKLISLEGAVETKRANEETWHSAALKQGFCTGDTLRTGYDSRAAVRLTNETLLRLDGDSALTFTHVEKKTRSIIDLLLGAVHFISRTPKSLEVRTPYVNASIEGTEFVVQIKESATNVTVFEGLVVATNTAGSIELAANQTAHAANNQAPVRIAKAIPLEAVTWALYYPPLPEQPDAADTLAQQTITAITQNRIDEAAELAKQARANDSQSAAAYMAQSYVDQAQFNIPAALANSQKAAELAPQSALTQARLAEVWLMTGDTQAAQQAANQAVALDPKLSLSHAVLGFASLREVNLDAAMAAFEAAISLDSAAPLPRLGLGLVKIRQGALQSGREEIETAALLDPGNALLRSYLGKAYYEEKRSNLASDQFAMAKSLDPNDPTAWLYDSILLQSENRPIEALQDQQQAIRLNDNRAVYRSRQLLDEDQAARSASLANTYNDLGFERLALKESLKSLIVDPGNPSAHRFLAEAYTGVPRHEIARVSELMQAQMLTPEIVTPVSPSASEANLLAFQGSGPSLAGYNEYNPLFNRQRLSLIASGITGSNNTHGEEIAVGGFTNRGMLSAGYFKESSDGFRENNDSEQTMRNVFGQFRVTSELSVQGEVKHREGEFGDMVQRFDSSIVFDDLNRAINSDSYRLGINYSPDLHHTLLISVGDQELDDRTTLFGNQVDTNNDGRQYEAQYLYHGDRFNLVTGLGRLDLDTTSTLTLPFFGALPPSADTLDQNTAHLYATMLYAWGQAILGVDYVSIDDHSAFSEDQYNPKFGLLWQFSNDTLLRLAAFRTLRPEMIDNQSLMPTEVAGFNQIYDDYLSTEAKRYAFGIDQHIGQGLDAGLEFSKRDLSTIPDTLTTVEEDQHELSHKGYLYWQIDSHFKLSSEISYETFEREFIDGVGDLDRPASLDTTSFKLSGGYFHSNGFFADLAAIHVNQEIEQVQFTTGTTTDSDSFWVANAELGYRLPKRLGLLNLQIKNLFDQTFDYQSILPGTGTPENSPYYPERTVYLTAQFWL